MNFDHRKQIEIKDLEVNNIYALVDIKGKVQVYYFVVSVEKVDYDFWSITWLTENGIVKSYLNGRLYLHKIT
jgi:hypothetical protein